MPSSARKKTSPETTAHAPTPLREIGPNGQVLWSRLWMMENPWISKLIDLDYVTLLCEAVDERDALRKHVLTIGDWRDRVALRALDDQIDKMGAYLRRKAFLSQTSAPSSPY